MKYLNKKIINSISILLALLISAMLVIPAMPVLANATQSVTLSAHDRSILFDMMSNIARDEGVRLNNYTYTAKKIYLASERQIGYVVDFDFDKSNGYAIVLTDNGFDIAEISLNEKSPFCGKEGKYIYPALGAYFTKNNGIYYDLSNNASYPKLNIDDADAFFGSRGGDDEEFLYVHNYFNGGHGREPSNKQSLDPDGFPKYSYDIPNFYYQYYAKMNPSHEGNCSNVAGLILLNHWNKQYNNAILKLSNLTASPIPDNPNYDYDIGNITDADALLILNTFYINMHTSASGTTVNNFYSGFSNYLDGFDYKIKRTKYSTGENKPSFWIIKENIKNNIPFVICSANYYFAGPMLSLPKLSDFAPYDYDLFWGYYYDMYIDYYRYSKSHMFLAYGYAYYELDRYINVMISNPLKPWLPPTEGLGIVTDTVELLRVATGWGNSTYFNYNLSSMHELSAVEVVSK